MISIIGRLKDDRYLHLLIDPVERRIFFINAIPELERQELKHLADKFNYTMHLEITSETILPTRTEEYKSEELDTITFLTMLLEVYDKIIGAYHDDKKA